LIEATTTNFEGENMMENKYFDFDQYMEERRGHEKPFVIKAFGEEHVIPNDIPFDVVLEITRAQKDGKTTMTDDQLVTMSQTLFGEETFKKWLKKGIGLAGIMVLTEKVMEMYMKNASDLSHTMAKRKSGENTP
jgi:hypothetical protein